MNPESCPLISEIRQLVAGGDLQLALDRLKVVCHPAAPRLYDEVTLLEARFARHVRDDRRGMLPRDLQNAEWTRLAEAILGVVHEVAKRTTPPWEAVRASSFLTETAPLQGLTTQQILGINNLKQISWIEVGLRAARSVCRILTPSGCGTGFLVADGLLMTNWHVIPTAEVAGKSQAEFDYQQDAAGGFLAPVRYALGSADFHSHQSLDFALVRIWPRAGDPPLERWGNLCLNPQADPVPSEHVIIIQHPNGGYKQIAMTANCVVAARPPMLHYTTDTMPGSSGSPVFNDSWQVIAIHHAGGQIHKDPKGSVRYVNEGVLMSAIAQAAGSHWPR